ncbi:MAG: hypothetical protein AB1450_01480 [Pseudomonadota bacterium]
MIGTRARYSLAQFLELYEVGFVVVLLGKHGMHASVENGRLLSDVLQSLRSATDAETLSLLDEIARTSGDLRTRVSPRYRYDERFSDLCRCLELDGYVIDQKRVVQTDPSVSDAPPLEDDLIDALKVSGLDDALAIVSKIDASSESFRSSPPNYNACLNDIRIALETLAKSIAEKGESQTAPPYDKTKWGSVISFLRQVGFITHEEEKGLAGVYGFISPGSHRPIGISEEQMARLGRSLALSMCWFLVKTHEGSI